MDTARMARCNESVVIVTGGGGGIGRACSVRFAEAGAQVIAASRSRDALVETRAIITKKRGRCDVETVDVSVAEQVDRLVSTVIDRYGRVDVLVNNAGIAPLGTVDAITPERFDELVAVNIAGVYYGCRAVFPIMRERGGGAIVNISSIASVDPFPGLAAYGASKAWVNAWTKGLANEGKAHGVRVFAVAPGAAETPMLRGAFPDYPEDQALDPSDVAELVFAMCQPACRHVTGQTVFIKK
jgi:NAD(P)-dependent dehydrogenase (short-subunit alcohol dehydrogenase family)